MSRRTLPYAIITLTATIFFVLGVAVAPLLGLIPAHILGGHPAATISLDLSGQVRDLQQQSARLNKALEDNVGRIAELERALDTARHNTSAGNGDSQALQDRVAELTRKLDAAKRQNELLTAKANGLTRTQTDLLVELDAARVRAGSLQDSLDDQTRASKAREQALSDRIASLNAELGKRDDEISGLRDRLEQEVARSLPDTEPDKAHMSDTAPHAPEAVGTLADGVAAYQAGDYTEAYRIWRALAEQGNARAQFHLGALYYEGRGVARNLTNAHRWLGRAAANGSDPARRLLAKVEAELSAQPTQ